MYKVYVVIFEHKEDCIVIRGYTNKEDALNDTCDETCIFDETYVFQNNYESKTGFNKAYNMLRCWDFIKPNYDLEIVEYSIIEHLNYENTNIKNETEKFKRIYSINLLQNMIWNADMGWLSVYQKGDTLIGDLPEQYLDKNRLVNIPNGSLLLYDEDENEVIKNTAQGVFDTLTDWNVIDEMNASPCELNSVVKWLQTLGVVVEEVNGITKEMINNA